MFEICVPVFPDRVTDVEPSNTDPDSYSLTVAVTVPGLGLYTPTFVRNDPVALPALDRFVNTVTAFAAVEGSPGMNIPTDPTVPAGHGGDDAGENRRDVTTIPPEGVSNSTAPSELGTPNRLTQMSSNAFASRAASW